MAALVACRHKVVSNRSFPLKLLPLVQIWACVPPKIKTQSSKFEIFLPQTNKFIVLRAADLIRVEPNFDLRFRNVRLNDS